MRLRYRSMACFPELLDVVNEPRAIAAQRRVGSIRGLAALDLQRV